MFEIHVGNTPCQLSSEDYQALGDRTEGYSGSDIAIVVRDALMQPVRKVISATHFKQIPDPENGKLKWTPCSHGDPAAVEKTWTDVDSDELLEPPLKLTDFLKSLEITPPTVTDSDVKRHLEWTKEAGTFRWFLYSNASRFLIEACRAAWDYRERWCLVTGSMSLYYISNLYLNLVGTLS